MSSVAELSVDVAIHRHKKAILSADSVEEAGAYLRTLGVTQKHIDFLSGVGGLPKLREAYFQCIEFDLKHGTQTFKYIHEDEMKLDALLHPEHFARPESVQHGVKHRSSLTNVIKRGIDSAVEILREKYGIDASDASFFDLGTGTGKPLIIAGKDYNFAFSTGIDYNEPLLEDAKRNLKAAGLDSLSNIRAIFADAKEFKRFNGTNVVFMYNPFLEPIMKEVEKNLRRNGGKTVVIYNKPLYAKLFSKERGWQQETHFIAGDHSEQTFDADHEVMVFSRGFDKHKINNPSPTGELKSPEI